MHASPVVFCERTGYWAAAWRRAESRLAAPLARRRFSPRLIETRSAAECREAIAAHADAFVVAELAPPTIDETLDLLFHISGEMAGVAIAVVAGREWLPYEWLARELGAQAFVVSPLELEGLRELAARHQARAVAAPIHVRQQIWENLPWS